MMKQILLFTASSRVYLILQECAVILDIDCRTKWQGMIKLKSVSVKEHGVHGFGSTLTAP